jgi:hypothetical protein
MGKRGMSTPAGWYQDPTDASALRWWNGSSWTDRIAPAAIPLSPGQVFGPPPSLPELTGQRDHLLTELEELRALVVETRDMMLLQEVGLYRYSHPLDSSAQYSEAIGALAQEIQACIKSQEAVTGTKKWAINGSEKEGAKMVADFGKLMLRAYNTEADNVIRTLKPFTLPAAIERLQKMKTSISKLGLSMKLQVTDKFHALRVRELQLTADFLAKVAEEKDREREERARLKEEEAARKDFEREQARLEKERAHYQAALNALRMNGDATAVAAAEGKLTEIESAIQGVIARAANIRAGYVYVISNIGSFGETVVKIGMTRRLEPMDRVRELGDASVPFRFDVHALIFSDDAVGLENNLHRAFADQRVNMVNMHREFFYATPLSVKEALLRLKGDLLTYTDQPQALEWNQSRSIHTSRQAPQTEGVRSPTVALPAAGPAGSASR